MDPDPTRKTLIVSKHNFFFYITEKKTFSLNKGD
jgi:hypothetical protein